ncbi:tetratricopeptide repeat protein [Lachnospiraceae bacterium 45-W7]
METSLITIEDMDYLVSQSSDNMNMILSGMTALLDENNEKAEMLGSQTWFQRMSRTITGKNKMTQAEIQQNHDKINLYVTQAMAELFERNCIDQQIMTSLGTRLNELYADHIQLKQMLGAFADKLSQKIVSIDNFHMLETEIEQGVFDGLMPVAAMCKVLSQLDIRTLNDARKLDILERSLQERGILSDGSVKISEYLTGLLNTSESEIGVIYMELGTQQDNFIANIFKQVIENYHFLPATVKMMKKKELVMESVIQQNQLDDSVELALGDIYHEFLDAKVIAAPKIELQKSGSADSGEISNELHDGVEAFLKCNKEGIENLLEPLAEQEDGLALYLMSFFDYLQTDVRGKDFLERGHIAGNPMASIRYAKRCQDKGKANKIVKDNIGRLKDMALQGDMFAQYEYALLFSERSKFTIEQEEGVDTRELLQASAEQGFWVAIYQLADRYRCGIDGETDNEKAFKLFSKLNQMKVLPGITALAEFYMKGCFVEKNEEKAVKLYERAIECGYSSAKVDLAWCYQYGLGVYKDLEKARGMYGDYLDDIPGFYENAFGSLEVKSVRNISKAHTATYQIYLLDVEEDDEICAFTNLQISAKCGNPQALYEYAKYASAEDEDDYAEMYPDDPCSGVADWIPYDLELAQYCLEEAKKYTNDEKLLSSIGWLEVKITFKDAKNTFNNFRNLF